MLRACHVILIEEAIMDPEPCRCLTRFTRNFQTWK
jgi:hypothetical protein